MDVRKKKPGKNEGAEQAFSGGCVMSRQDPIRQSSKQSI